MKTNKKSSLEILEIGYDKFIDMHQRYPNLIVISKDFYLRLISEIKNITSFVDYNEKDLKYRGIKVVKNDSKTELKNDVVMYYADDFLLPQIIKNFTNETN